MSSHWTFFTGKSTASVNEQTYVGYLVFPNQMCNNMPTRIPEKVASFFLPEEGVYICIKGQYINTKRIKWQQLCAKCR